jgi:Uma2 family endonuclease
LQEYLLIEPRTRRCELYRKSGDGLWVLHPSEEGQVLALSSVDLSVSAATLWEDVPRTNVSNKDTSAEQDQATP